MFVILTLLTIWIAQGLTKSTDQPDSLNVINEWIVHKSTLNGV